MFAEEVVTADLDLRRATGENAQRSLSRGPLADWWKEGLKRVRDIKEETGNDSQVSGR